MASRRRALLSGNVLAGRQQTVEQSAWTEGLHWFSDLFSDDCVSSCAHRFECEAGDDACVCSSTNLHSIYYCLDTECYKTDATDFMSEVKEWCDDYYGNSRWLTSSIVYATRRTAPTAGSVNGTTQAIQSGTPVSTAIVQTTSAPSSQQVDVNQGASASPVSSEPIPTVEKDKDDGSGLATGSLVGIICGTILLIVLVLAACWLYRKYLKQVRVRQVAELAKLQRRGDPHPAMTQTGAGTMTYPSGFDMSIASTAASDTYFIRQSPRHKKFKQAGLPALPESMIMPEQKSAGQHYFGETSTDSSSTPYSPSIGTSLGLSYLGSYKSDQRSS